MVSQNIEEALNDLWRVLHRHLLKIGADPEDARDIVQEAMYKWLLYAESVNIERVPAWLFRVTMNLYYDQYRKKQRRVFIDLDEALLIDFETPEAHLLRKDNREQIQKTLESLPLIQQHLLVMKYSEFMSYAEISILLGMPISTITTYLQRARLNFRRIYKEES